MATSTKIKDASVINVTSGLKLAVGNTSDDTTASAITVSGLKTFIDSDKSAVALTGSYNDLVDTPNLNNYALVSTLNSNFYNKNEVNNLINSIHTAEFKVVDALPLTGEPNIIYLLPNEQQGYQNVYDEYIFLVDSNSYELIGTTQTDLSNYYTKSEVNNLIPSVGNGIITINQDGVQKGVFTLNQNSNATIEIESGSFEQQQADWDEQDSEVPMYIRNKPTIPTVGDGTITLKMGETTLGSFNVNQAGDDSIEIPETSQLQSNWNESDSNSPQYILNKPTIPTVNNPTINFSQGGVLKGSITLNQSSNATIFLDGGGSGSGEVQANWQENDPTSLAYIQNRPTLATVSTTGSYNDLLDTPTIPTAVQSDWTESDSSSIAFIKHKPTIYDSTITIQQGGVTKGTFTLNQSTGTTINLEGGGGGGSTQVQSNWTESDSSSVSFILNKPTLATVASSGSYNDLTNKPTIPAAQVNSDWNSASGVSQILNKPNLSTVASSGSYNDLTDKPTIPSNTRSLLITYDDTTTETIVVYTT